jgi:hypothetical protein
MAERVGASSGCPGEFYDFLNDRRSEAAVLNLRFVAPNSAHDVLAWALAQAKALHKVFALVH